MALFDNLIIKEVWDEILPAKYPTQSKLLSSGAVYIDNQSKFNGGGVYKRTPFAYEPTANMEKPASSTELTPTGLTMAQDTMVCINRQKDFVISKKELRRLGIITDSDQATLQGLDQLIGITSNYIAKQQDKYGYMILKGAFATTLAATHVQSSGATITMADIFAGKAKLGDNGYLLTDLFMHSKVKEDARAAGLVDYKLAGSFGQSILQTGTLDTIAGMAITESDMVNVTSDVVPVYSSYAFAKNSLYFANPYLSIEPYYIPNKGGGEFHVVISMDFVWHIPGVAYNISNQDPTDALLATGATWSKVADHTADIKVVEILNI